jgi:hypothetical protein
MNYASPCQDVVSSHGSANKQRLKSIAGEYDPTGVFQKLQPGYFKLEGAQYRALSAQKYDIRWSRCLVATQIFVHVMSFPYLTYRVVEVGRNPPASTNSSVASPAIVMESI